MRNYSNYFSKAFLFLILSIFVIHAKMDHINENKNFDEAGSTDLIDISNSVNSRNRYEKIRKNISDQKNYKIHQRRKVDYERKTLPKKLQSLKKGQLVFVDENLVDLVNSNIKTLLSGTRIAPHHDTAGKIDGYEILQIQKGCVLYSLGFRNGHIIHQVDKYKLNSMSVVYKAYRRLRKLSPKQLRVVMTVKDPDKRVDTLTFFPVKKEGVFKND